ncbi:MAG: hypothetical protein JEY99_05625 [Spirochaetales bacterium]|nr:hypothetical protein [Spirochaetales bacterium]
MVDNHDIKSPNLPNGVMLNLYPDSCNGNLKGALSLLKQAELADVFSLLYILPSLFESDLDRGFSVISYDLNKELAEREDLESLQKLGVSLKLDFVLNHLSVGSPQFKDLLEKGDDSEYVDMFIDWNKFWAGKGEKGPEGFIIPRDEYLSKLFMRKPEMPVLKLPFPDGTERFYWNTFYQKVNLLNPDDTKSEKSYLGQMDLNADSSVVWDFYEDTFKKLSSYGAKIVRLDAFAYLHKEAGSSNFFNEPGTWDHLEHLKQIADKYDLTLLPEIHSKYEDKIHEQLAEKGYPIYDFFFPGLLIHTLETSDNTKLTSWINEIMEKRFKTVNMLGCHDGIPVLDVKGYLDDQAIEGLIGLIKTRGGRVKDLFGADGKKISYYQINATFFSALGENEKKMLLARAIQIFMPGTPQVWYLDLFAGTNDYEAADNIGHKDINRTNLTEKEILAGLETSIVEKQLKLLKFRNTNPAFGTGATLEMDNTDKENLTMLWVKNGHSARLEANLREYRFHIYYKKGDEEWFSLL